MAVFQDVPQAVERETWMMELPDVLTKNMGMNLEARTFSRSKIVAKQDSSWTETPADKARREQVSASTVVFCVFLQKIYM